MLGLVAHEAHEAGGNSQSMMDKCWTQASGGLTKKPEGELVSDMLEVRRRSGAVLLCYKLW